MPTVNINTNVSKADLTDVGRILRVLTTTASQSIGKPEKYFVVIIHFDTALAFGGDPDTPAAYTEISSIGAIGGDKNAKIVEAISAVAETHLSIPTDRFYVKFHDIAASDWGWRGTTFDKLL